MLSKLFSLVAGGWEKILAYVGIAAVVLAVGAFGGYKYEAASIAKTELKQEKQVVVIQQTQQAVTDTHEASAVAAQTVIVNHYIPVQKNIDHYIATAPSAKVAIPDDAIDQLNAAVAAPVGASQ